MAEIRIPYAKTYLTANIPDANLTQVLESKVNEFSSAGSEEELVKNALNSPIESVSLQEMVKGKQKVVIITSDHTRPVPSRLTMPILLETIRNESSDVEINILIATGFHRPMSDQELLDRFGEEIVQNENIIVHYSDDQESLQQLGILPSGGELWINKAALDCDLLIAEGFIEPHFFAGFSGGRKAILPGIAGTETVLANHCSEFIASDFARTGVLKNNPIHKDMLFAAEQAKLAFILNVVLNEDKKVIAAFAGDSVKAHLKGCDFIKDLAEVPKVEADIVITSNGGYPLDQNIYQAVKGMTAGEACCKEDGIIIMVASCCDGHGGDSFYQNMADAESPKEVLERVLKIPRNETMPDQWEFQILARILEKYKVILVTDQCDPQIIKDMHMEPALTLDAAVQKAFQIKGKNASVTVIPDGVGVIVQ